MEDVAEEIKDFSTHLFWDIKPGTFDIKKNRRLVIERVLQRGTRSGVESLSKYYTRDEIRRVIKELPSLNEKDMAFAHIFFEIPFSEMKCFIKKPL